jgi:hypothetical protein
MNFYPEALNGLRSKKARLWFDVAGFPTQKIDFVSGRHPAD